MTELARVSKRGQIRIPAAMRRQLDLGEGDLLEVRIEGGYLVLTPKRLIDKSQGYCWTERWQEGEKQAEEDIQEGRVEIFGTPEALLEDLAKP